MLVFADADDVHARERLGVVGETAIGADDENLPQFVGVSGTNFANARIVCTRGAVGPHHQFDLCRDFRVGRSHVDRIEIASRYVPSG